MILTKQTEDRSIVLKMQ